MIRAVCVRNPFDPLVSREIREFEPGKSIRELVDDFYPEGSGNYTVEIAINGSSIDDPGKYDLVPLGDASVVFCAVPAGGQGKNPLAIVAILAVMIVSYGVLGPSVALEYASLTGTAYSAGLASVATMAGIVAGGLAIQAIFPMTQPDMGSGNNPSYSSTYAWEPGGNAILEGGSLPEVFGLCRVVPPIIGKYIESIDDKQYLNILYAVAGHEVYSITSVRVNGTATEDMTGVDVIPSRDIRLGTATQNVLQNFSDTRTDIAVGAKLTIPDFATTRTTTGNAVEKLLATFSFPKGIYYVNNSGGMEAQTIKIYVEYSIHDADSWTRLQAYNSATETVVTPRWSGGYWMSDEGAYPYWTELAAGSTTPGDHVEGDAYPTGIWYDDPDGGKFQAIGVWHWVVDNEEIDVIGTVLHDYFSVTRSQTSPVHISTPIVSLATPGQYDIRCYLKEELPSTARYGNDTYWESFQEIITDDFTYPGTALLAVRALATDQLSGGMPSVDCLVERSVVPVWTGAQYEDKLANIPAWACYHLLHRAEYKGTGDTSLAASYEVKGVPASRIDYLAFQSWAAWCTEKGYTVNLYVDQATSVRRALDMIATNGRGCVVQMGSKFSCIVDRIEITPVQRFMFTLGNIVADSFQEEWLPVTDRANAIEVTFFDSALDYSRQVVTIYAQDFDTAGHEINTMQATLYGCVTRDLAIKYGKFLINSNKYLTLTCSFEADVDAIACVLGDVIEVAHDVPQWGYSGRVVSSANSTVTVDRDIDITGVTHYVRVKHQDDDTFEEKEIISVNGTGRILTISGTWGKNPELHALYSVGHINAVVKLFRVLRISRSQELRRKITCLEYVADIYEDGATIPDPVNPSDLPRVANLTATEVYRGGAETKVALQWRGFALFWNVYYRRSGSAWTLFRRAYNPSCEISGLDYGILYECAVTGTDNPTDGKTVSITLRGKIDPPGDVATITAIKSGFSILVEWTAVTDFDLWGYELRVSVFGGTWDAATLLFKGNARSYTWDYKSYGSYTLYVKAIDSFGNESVNAAYHTETVGVPDAPVLSYLFIGQNVTLSWSIPDSYFAIDHYKIYYGLTPTSFVGTTKATTYSEKVSWGGSRKYWVNAYDVAGNHSNYGMVEVIVASPGAVIATFVRVIDNNVLLQWTPPATGSLPISYYEVSSGAVYATSVSVGTVLGTFSVVFEESSGSYIYWIVGYDTAGNAGAPVGIPAEVKQPPDYVILQNWTDDYSGTKVSAHVSDGKLYAPVNITETYTEHFAVNTTPQAQINAGYPLWIQPVPNTATYTRIFDYGTSIDVLTKITVEVPYTQEYGSATIAGTIEVSTNGSAWEAAVSGYTTLMMFSAMATGFRYVRVVLTITGASNTAILRIDRLTVKLDLKQINDTGRIEVTSNPTTVNFNKAFIDVISIGVTAEGTTALFAIYDFTDIPNPTHFHVYLFDSGGADASGAGKYVSWTTRGV